MEDLKHTLPPCGGRKLGAGGGDRARACDTPGERALAAEVWPACPVAAEDEMLMLLALLVCAERKMRVGSSLRRSRTTLPLPCKIGDMV